MKEEREGREVPNFNPRERKKKDYEDIFGSKTYKYLLIVQLPKCPCLKRIYFVSDTLSVLS